MTHIKYREISGEVKNGDIVIIQRSIGELIGRVKDGKAVVSDELSYFLHDVRHQKVEPLLFDDEKLLGSLDIQVDDKVYCISRKAEGICIASRNGSPRFPNKPLVIIKFREDTNLTDEDACESFFIFDHEIYKI